MDQTAIVTKKKKENPENSKHLKGGTSTKNYLNFLLFHQAVFMNYFGSSFPFCVCTCTNKKLHEDKYNLCLLLVLLPQTAQEILRARTKDLTSLKLGHIHTTE